MIVANALQSHAEQSLARVRKCAFALPHAGTGVTCPCFDSMFHILCQLRVPHTLLTANLLWHR